jgi:hypothetical protein
MESNTTDLPSMVFLPELLYRLEFPGQFGLAKGRLDTPPPPVIKPRPDRSWRSSLYGLKYDRNPITRWMRRRLPTAWFHYTIEKRLGMNGVPLCPDDCRLGAQPPMWYSPVWPRMQAFALPSFSEGYVRINVKGREAQGIVEPSDYERACEHVVAQLRLLTNARTGEPLVKQTVRTRRDPFHAALRDGRPSDADLIVLWSDEPADVADHPVAGRIGPVPYKRSGSHVHRGFVMARGEGIPAALRLPQAHALTLAPTLLTLVGAPIPAHFEGRPLFEADGTVVGSSPQVGDMVVR